MPQFDENGLFAGLSKDDKAAAILTHLSVDDEITLQELMAATGLTSSQVHTGIRHLREAKPHCVVTIRRGPTSAYRLAEDAPEVRDYARRRMAHWRAQVQVISAEVETARKLLPKGEMRTVSAVAVALSNLMALLDVDLAIQEDFEKQRRQIEREVVKLNKKKAGAR